MQWVASIFILTFSVLIIGCVPPVVPEFSGQAPKSIHSSSQVRQAIELALAEEHWQIISIQHHNILQVYKQHEEQSASVYIVYGTEGYSMEYASSHNMQYNIIDNTIDPRYRAWVYSLNASIEYQLKQQAKQLKKHSYH